MNIFYVLPAVIVFTLGFTMNFAFAEIDPISDIDFCKQANLKQM